MFFVPVRKLLKVIFVRSAATKRERVPLSHEQGTVPESRRRCSRKWILLIIMTLICFYIVSAQKNTPNVLFLRQPSVNAYIFNENKGNLIEKTSTKLDIENKLMLNILDHHDEDIKEGNITTITTTNKSIVNKNDKPNNNTNVTQISTEAYELGVQTVPNNELPICRSFLEENEDEERIKPNRPDNLFVDVKMGGYYAPKTCRSRHKVAILVPYRNRERNLAVFLYHMHPFLMRQKLEYRIFIIEQTGEKLFNRGKLFNIGFLEMQKYNDWRCVVMHDVDLLPQSDKILYTCPTFPRHMCGTVVQKAKLTYNQYHTLFGGVSALSVEHYKLINGYSNMYWGWGGEDNDMYWRILSTRIPIVRYNKTIAQYKSLPHPKQPKNNQRYQLLKYTVARCKTDGLSNLEYKMIWTKNRHLYTHILADVNPLKKDVTNVFSKLF